jgi:hypothetical protein
MEELHPGFSILPQLDRSQKNGEEIGRLQAILAIRNEIVRVSSPMLVDREYIDGLEKAVELIEGLPK